MINIQKSVAKKLITLFSILSASEKLNFIEDNKVVIRTREKEALLTISSERMIISSLLLPEHLFGSPSPLPDDFVTSADQKILVQDFIYNDSVIRLNHVGIGYLVDSVISEKKRLSNKIRDIGWQLYREESNIKGQEWLFMGNADNWQDPMVQFFAVETYVPSSRYWIPQIQIDIDTTYSEQELTTLIVESFRGSVYPEKIIADEKYVYLIRARLGIVSGMNIMLDLGTRNRNTYFHRNHLLQKVD